MTGSTVDGRFRHSQKLEELRNFQEQISHERAQFTREKEHWEKWMSDKKVDLNKLDIHLKEQEKDINQQRDALYRKLESLQRNQGIIMGSGMTLIQAQSPLYDDSSSGK